MNMDHQVSQLNQSPQVTAPQLTVSEYCGLLDIDYSVDKLASTRRSGKPVLSGDADLTSVAYLVCFFRLDALAYLKLLSEATLDHDPVLDTNKLGTYERSAIGLLESDGIVHIDDAGLARIVWGIGPNKRWSQ